MVLRDDTPDDVIKAYKDFYKENEIRAKNGLRIMKF